MAYTPLPGKPNESDPWKPYGDALHGNVGEAVTDQPGLAADAAAAKASVQGLSTSRVNSNNPHFTGTVTGVTKARVGLGNVTNTADADKTLTAGQFDAGRINPERLPTAVAAIRTRTPAAEANPTASNWLPRPTGYPRVLNIGKPPAPSDAQALDLSIPTYGSGVFDGELTPIVLTDGSRIDVRAGSADYDGNTLIGSITNQIDNTTTYNAYVGAFKASDHLAGYRQMARNVCSLLYATPAAVPRNVPNLVLQWTSAAGVLAQTWSGPPPRIEFGAASRGATVTASYSTHEVVHLFGHSPTNGTSQTSGVVEGIADWCLIQLGYHTAANQQPADGGTAWDAGYDTTAFFLDWIERLAPTPSPGFVRALNASLNVATWNKSAITGINARGRTVEQLWTEYKAILNPAPPVGTPTMPFTDRTFVTYTASGQTSTYHAWANGRAAGNGLFIWLHGDGAYEHKNPNSTYVFGGTNGVVSKMRARGYVTVSALSPDTQGSITWWENGSTRADYLKALIATLTAGYASDPNKLIIAGFSGGAQHTTQYYMPKYSSSVTGGASIVFGGGGAPVITVQPIPAALKPKFYMYWATGALDDAAHSGEGYDALKYAKAGANWYEGQGFTVGRNWIPGATHEIDGQFGGICATVVDSKSFL